MSFVTRALGISSNRAPQAVVSKKAPSGALTPLTWSNPDQPTYPDFSGQAAIELGYLRNVYVYKCVSSIANSIAGLPFRAGDPVSNNYRLTHPLARLLGPAQGSPNPSVSAATLWRYAIAQYLLLGKFAWRIERYQNQIVGLWPLQTQYLNPEIALSGAGYFSKFHYGVQGQPGYQVFNPSDVCYIWRPSLKDFRKPESPIQMASVNINVAKMLDQFDYSFLKNGGVPAHLIITPGFATEQDRKNFQAQFEADFGGAANAGRSMFAERDFDPGEGSGQVDSVDVKTIGTTQRDAQLQNVRQAEIQAICVAFGVPLSIIGDASHRTFSNADAERRNYYLETLLPLSRELQDGVNIQLAPLIGKEVGWFDTRGVPELRPEPVLPEDAHAVELEKAGAFTWDEWRADHGLPPGAEVGLDKIWAEMKAIPVPVAPADSLIGDANGNTPPPASAPARKKSFAEIRASIGESSNVEVHYRWICQPGACDACLELDGEIDVETEYEGSLHPNCRCDQQYFIEMRHAGPEHDSVPSGHLTKAVLERVLTASLRSLLEAQSQAVAYRLNSRRGKNATELLDVEYWTKRTTETLSPILREMGLSTESRIADLIVENAEFARSGGALAQRLEPMLFALAGVPVTTVEEILLQISAGKLDIDAALQTLGAGYGVS